MVGFLEDLGAVVGMSLLRFTFHATIIKALSIVIN